MNKKTTNFSNASAKRPASDTGGLVLGTLIIFGSALAGGVAMAEIAPTLPVADVVKFGLPVAGCIAGIALGIALTRKITPPNPSHFRGSHYFRP